MIYYISIDEEVADVLQEIDVDELQSILKDNDKLKEVKSALSKFQEAYSEAIDNGDYSLTSGEQEQSYNFQIDKCN